MGELRAAITPLVMGLISLCALCAGCAPRGSGVTLPKGVPVVRVRILQACSEVRVAAAGPLWAKSQADLTSQPVNFPPAPGATLKLVHGAWYAGGVVPMGSGELTLTPGRAGTVSIEGHYCRGRYRLIPAGQDLFDVVNDVDVDGYLKGVLPVELYPNWEDEAYKALAIAGRTYAIYESRVGGLRRAYDLNSDERSQMYKGIGSETNKSVRAVDATAGVVVTYGPPGQERIFRAYYSSCCGGKTQSAYDAFGDDYLPPLGDFDRGGTCSNSNKFKWGPVTISKAELSKRFAAWAKHKSEQQGQPRPELKMQGVARIEQAFVNKLGRPILFYVTDNSNMRFLMRAEDVRLAIASEANGGPTVYSGYFNTVNEADRIRFVDGHGYGHGVGMCQWCAQRQAVMGWRYEDIVAANYPGTKLIKAY